jgi:hypothetical protein
MKPRIGQTVIVVQSRQGSATTESPAIITRVMDGDALNLMVFADLQGAFPLASVKRDSDADLQPGQSFWRPEPGILEQIEETVQADVEKAGGWFKRVFGGSATA